MAPNMFLVYGNAGDGNTYIYGMDYSSIGGGGTDGLYFPFANWDVVSDTGNEIATNQE
jgi:hypothetical protein